MTVLPSYLGGEWVAGRGEGEALLNPATEETLARASSSGLDLGAALGFARQRGGPELRGLTFAERGERLARTAALLQQHRDELIELAMTNGGNTRGDAKFDIDGAILTLQAYAETGRALGAKRRIVDGGPIQLGRTARFSGQHVFTTRRGVAIHVNAFNFPAWGLAEKAAVALLAGMPVLTKPATSSALPAHRLFEILIAAKIWPEGALSILLGRAGDLLDHVEGQDCVAFTGGSSTGVLIRRGPGVAERGARVNVEADSLNAAILGPDAANDGDETRDFFVKDVVRDMTQKAGQKCTAIRRVLVPQDRAESVRDEIAEKLSAIVVGNPATEGVRMGPVATATQKAAVLDGISLLARDGRLVYSRPGFAPSGVEKGRGFFVPPTLLELEPGADAPHVHGHEVFGPVATIVPYDASGSAEDAASRAAKIVARGEGGLVSSVYSEDVAFVGASVEGLAPYHGRVFLGSAKIAEQSPGPGTVLASLVHGGPGRAGNGEELGGERGLAFYMQRTALEGSRPVVDRVIE
jgi:oxepin-CoA hydrolase/3-oxo-5,6-dehydrosuberyl-CoA semialdehyde dehydrogenase